LIPFQGASAGNVTLAARSFVVGEIRMGLSTKGLLLAGDRRTNANASDDIHVNAE